MCASNILIAVYGYVLCNLFDFITRGGACVPGAVVHSPKKSSLCFYLCYHKTAPLSNESRRKKTKRRRRFRTPPFRGGERGI